MQLLLGTFRLSGTSNPSLLGTTDRQRLLEGAIRMVSELLIWHLDNSKELHMQGVHHVELLQLLALGIQQHARWEGWGWGSG